MTELLISPCSGLFLSFSHIFPSLGSFIGYWWVSASVSIARARLLLLIAVYHKVSVSTFSLIPGRLGGVEYVVDRHSTV